jgi:hypothetical protein
MSDEPRGRRGRPPKPALAWQELLTIRQALLYVRSVGRRMSYATIHKAIVAGDLPAVLDTLRHDNQGRPLLVFTKPALDAWLNQALQPIPVRDLRSA